MALVDGQSWPAGDLARHAGIKPATASYHLELLVSGGLLLVIPQGRHRYYRLASPVVAEMLEKLAALAPPSPARSLRSSQKKDALRFGRTCYDHLAGQLGVAWAQAWVDNDMARRVTGGYELTEYGVKWLENNHIMVTAETFIPEHAVDWTERVSHFAGPLAKRMTERLFDIGWIERGSVLRSVRVTPVGRAQLENLGMKLANDLISES